MATYTDRVLHIVERVKELAEAEKEQLTIALGNDAILGKERRELAMLGVQLLNLSELLAAKLASRDRKSDPETVEQDEQVYALRLKDRRTWSWKKLARQFGMTKRGAEKAFKRHAARLEKSDEERRRADEMCRSEGSLDVILGYVNELLAKMRTD